MSGNPASPPPFISGIATIAGSYDVILSDIWGVLHNGREHFAPACAALASFRANGGAVVLITNAPRPAPPVLKQLEALNVPNGAFDDIVTSGDVTLSFIAGRGATPLYHIGPPRDRTLFDVLARQTGLRPPLTPLDEAQYVVCTGLFDDSHAPSDYDADLAVMRERGMDMICANPDIVVHVGDHEVWCAGALAQRYRDGGGQVFQAGKPFAPIYDRALELAQARRGTPVAAKRVLAIGDGIGTDIKGASAYGLDVIFVTSGIHREDLHGRDRKAGDSSARADIGALMRLLAASDVRPLAAMTRLAW